MLYITASSSSRSSSACFSKEDSKESNEVSPNQAPLYSRAHWITPEEQLKRLRLPIAEKVSNLGYLIPDLAELVAQYALDEPLTNWYTALTKLKALPDKIPPLPEDIGQMLNSKCPIYHNKKKANGTSYKIKDTHFLSLIPEEFSTLNKFERNILKPYGEQVYSKDKNPLKYRSFWNSALRHADELFPDTHWVLMTKDVLPGSRNKFWSEQVGLMNDLYQETGVNYEIPTLQQSFAAITTDMVATKRMRYQDKSDKNGNVCTYTHVKETALGRHLAVGAFSLSGVNITRDYGVGKNEAIGIAAFRRL